jgi:hypothetical protein
MSLQEFREHRNRLSPREIRALVLVVLAISLLIGLLALGNYFFIRSFPLSGEYHLFRIASRSFLFDRIEPYSANVPAAVQQEVYGRFARPGEKPYILDLPFHLLPAFFPLALFANDTVAQVFWLIILEVGLVAFLLMSLRLASSQVPLYVSGAIVLLCCGSFYSVQSLRLGSVAILLAAAYTGTLLSLRFEMDELAGALLVLSAFHWQIGAPILIFIVISVYWAQRWRVFLGAAMLLFILLVISFLLYPGWILPFMRAGWNNLIVDFGFSSRKIFAAFWPQYGDVLSWGLTGFLVIVLGIEWNESRGADFNRVVWVACLTIASTPLLGFRSELGHLVSLLFPLTIILLAIRQRWKTTGTILALVLGAIVVGLPWVIYTGWISFPGDTGQYFLYLFLPILTLMGLYWVRWWMIRLPRTWMDQVSAEGRK